MRTGMALLFIVFCWTGSAFAALALDEKPAGPSEWGYRPFDGSAPEMNPPGFVWRPQKEAASYEMQCAADAQFAKVVVSEPGLQFACFCPSEAMAPGKYFWRYRFVDKKQEPSAWSTVRSFEVKGGEAGAILFPMPPAKELLARIPAEHPRLFIRPEQLPALRQAAKGALKAQYDGIARDCEKLLKDPPPTAEPPRYPPGMKTKSDEWMKIWWGNRTYTIQALNSAALLGFAHRLGGKEEYAALGRRILMEVCAWDPKGSTNYHYNDEAGMPYVYFFARAYTFLNDRLSEAEKTQCREMMRFRGNEMYRHLNPRHLWSPYASHSNRAWHKLGEAGIAFLGEIPEARDWVLLAMNVFYNVYPVWCDDEGGWHEGVSYWNSYQSRFSYFADVMRVAMGIDAFKKPYFSRAGYYPMYLQPPGTPGGGFGDLVADRPASGNWALVTTLAAQAQNPYWQWYVSRIAPAPRGGPPSGRKSAGQAQADKADVPAASPEGGYIGFIRGMLPKVPVKAPDDLPSSRVFRGIGQAYLNSNLKDGAQNVEVGFKSSPFGTQSHGYDSNNTFFLYAYGQRLFAPTGRRDAYGSEHHKQWMWETMSTNGILVNGKGQSPIHSSACTGKITGFSTSNWVDYVAGDASRAYGDALSRFERHIVFLKPEVVIIWDRLEAPAESTFDLLLHSPVEIMAAGKGGKGGQKEIALKSSEVECRAAVLWPRDLEVAVTNQYQTPPRPKIKGPDGHPLKEWHLSARSKPARKLEFVTVIRVAKPGAALAGEPVLESGPSGFTVTAKLETGETIVRLGAGERSEIEVHSAGQRAKFE